MLERGGQAVGSDEKGCAGTTQPAIQLVKTMAARQGALPSGKENRAETDQKLTQNSPKCRGSNALGTEARLENKGLRYDRQPVACRDTRPNLVEREVKLGLKARNLVGKSGDDASPTSGIVRWRAS